MSPPAQQTVFIVDDEAAIRKSLQLLIEMLGVSVRTFPSAARYLDAYQPGDAGCLILDLRMPGMNGLDLQQELIRRGFNMPVIVLTGSGAAGWFVYGSERARRPSRTTGGSA